MLIQELPKISPEELCQTGAGNFNSLLLVTIEFLKQRQIPVMDYVQYVGQRFASTWPQNLTILDVAKWMAQNFMSVGAKIEDLAGDENESHFVMTGWFPEEISQRYASRPEEIDRFIEVTRPIAEHQNLSLEVERQGDRVICKFIRRA
jgi:hypothetical protein